MELMCEKRIFTLYLTLRYYYSNNINRKMTDKVNNKVNNDVAVISNNLVKGQNLDSSANAYLDRLDFDNQIKVLEYLVKSKKVNAKTPEEAFGVYMKCKDLALPFMTASDHIHVINGKTGVGINIIYAKLLKAGVGITWKHTKNLTPLHEYVDSAGNKYVSTTLPANAKMFVTKSELEKIKEDAKALPVGLVSPTPIEYTSEYVFTRQILMPDGKLELMEVTSTFTYSEAKAQGLHEKENWQKMLRRMMNVRAFTLGAREIGGDLLMGVYEKGELLDANNIEYSVTEEEVTIIPSNE